MKRKILIVLLSIGTVAGFASGFAHHRWRSRHFESHVADVCADAARRAQAEKPVAPATKAPH
jgi:hypothetical protein